MDTPSPSNMKHLLVHLEDLPDEILIYILTKLSKVAALYSLTGVNQRLNRIVHDPVFTSRLYLLSYCPENGNIYPLNDAVLDRFSSSILPQIGYQVKSLFLEGTSMERILHATNYRHLNDLTLCKLDVDVAKSLFVDENLLSCISKDQILSFAIDFDKPENSESIEHVYVFIFTQILTNLTNLRHLKFNPSALFFNELSFGSLSPTFSSSILLELHVPSQEEPLPNLRIFSLDSSSKIYYLDQSIVPLLRRMISLEELQLNLNVELKDGFLDGNRLKNDILIYMRQLHKFTFNICSTVYHRYQTHFPAHEDIQKSFEDFYRTQTIMCVNHFQEERFSQCCIYSPPYKWKVYNNITNNFTGGIFTSVTKVSLHDDRPFEYEFFVRIAQSFPFMKQLKIMNNEAQNDKHPIKLTNNDQPLSVIKYPNLTILDFFSSHDDYVELFLLDTKMSLPKNVRLWIDYQSLERVTHNFTRNETRNNCQNFASLLLLPQARVDERIKNYFPYTSIE